jgi:pimeloyl-ACP methyl ester carboxylesterase
MSRAGFGGSSRQAGRSVLHAAADAAAIADHLGGRTLPHRRLVGWGTTHVLACAALLPERVSSAATIAGVAPYDADGLEWTAGMGEDNQVEYPTAARDPDELLRWMEPRVRNLRAVEPEEIVADLRSVISDVDEGALDGPLGALLAESFHRAFVAGPRGWYDDDLAFVRPWGFDLSSIDVPVAIWQGHHDLMVPFAHGEWLVEHVPTARSRLRPEHGHLSLAVDSIGEILDDLLEAVATASP